MIFIDKTNITLILHNISTPRFILCNIIMCLQSTAILIFRDLFWKLRGMEISLSSVVLGRVMPGWVAEKY